MKKYRYFLRLVVGASILYTNLIPRAYCAQSDGLKIDFSRGIQEAVHTGESKSSLRLTDGASSTFFEKASYTLLQDDASLSDSDTDDKEESSAEADKNACREDGKLDTIPVSKNARSFKYNRSRHPGRATKTEDYDPTSNYVKVEFAPEKFRTQLSQDALGIVKALNNLESEKHTTCLCVALRDKHERVKKFVFHNGGSVMSPTMRTKAHESGYDVIQTERSHAEGQFMQFLLYRHKQRPGLYTHIMGMGCSRPHCSKCDHIFKTLLGSNYYKVTAAVYEKREEIVLPTTNQAEWDDLLSRFKETSTNTNGDVTPASFTPMSGAHVTITTPGTVLGQDATDNKDYNDYYLQKLLHQTLVNTTGEEYDSSGGWVTNSSSKETGKKQKRRNR